MVAPYITGIPGWNPVPKLAEFLIRHECAMEIITGKPDAGNGSLSKIHADLMVGYGVEILIHTQPFLHAKMYQFTFPEGDRAAFVGSANFSNNGFEGNHEIVAFFTQKGDNDRVARQFEVLMAIGTNYHSWKLKKEAG